MTPGTVTAVARTGADNQTHLSARWHHRSKGTTLVVPGVLSQSPFCTMTALPEEIRQLYLKNNNEKNRTMAAIQLSTGKVPVSGEPNTACI